MLPRLPPKHEFKSITKDFRQDLNQLQPILQSSPITVKIQNPENIIVERFAELYPQSNLADVFITCGTNYDVLRAHRQVLSCSSVYFRDALEVAPCKHPVVLAKHISGNIMSKILEYMYLGQVTLKSESELKQFLSSAKYLQVTGIQDDQYSLTN